MAANYDALVQLTRDWTNRDAAALPDAIIQNSLRWAADKAYRTLRVPPLEQIVTYSAETLRANSSASSNRQSSFTSIAIPGDLIEFIQMREIDAEGSTTRLFNEKADVRTFRDIYAEKYNDFAVWTREAGNILLAPAFGNVGSNYGSTGVGTSEALELYYYRRLPALDARYDITEENLTAGLLIDNAVTAAPMGTTTAVLADGMTYYGMEVPNWLRDENERIALFGALAECFSYLQEDDQAGKYLQSFYKEIEELNAEDMKRDSSGGNIQVNFNGRGLI